MIEKLGIVWFGICALLGIAWFAFLVWAIYKIVIWLTHQSI